MIKIAIVGATGTTGRYVVDALALVESNIITTLVRPSSADKPEVQHLKTRGIAVKLLDLAWSSHDQCEALQGQDVIIAILPIPATADQIPLASAAKAAGVKRFVPTFFAPVAPPKGASTLRDAKEDVLNHIKKLQLPYTVVDVGWWYQLTLPKLSSGRIDDAVSGLADRIPGDGNTLAAFTDNRDVGAYIARIVLDPRTINRYVFAYTELLTMNQIYDKLEKISGESVNRDYISEEELLSKLHTMHDVGIRDDNFLLKAVMEYWHSWGIRGDNNDQSAEYLGYLLGKDLYPDMKGTSIDEYMQQLLKKG